MYFNLINLLISSATLGALIVTIYPARHPLFEISIQSSVTILAPSGGYPGDKLGITWGYLRISWEYSGDILGIFGGYRGRSSTEIIQRSLRELAELTHRTLKEHL